MRKDPWLALAAVAIVLAPLAACSAPAPRVVSDEGWGPEGGDRARAPRLETLPPAPRLAAVPEAKRVRWQLAGRLSELTVLPARTPSEHGVGLERTVLVNDAAKAYAELAGPEPLPSGALIVQRHHRAGSEAMAFAYAMRKDDAGWRFLVLDSEWRIALEGALDPCVRCHAEAPFDGVFGMAGPPR